MNKACDKSELKITFGGDVLCLRQETDAVLKKYGELDYDSYLEGLAPLFADSDYVAVNLETPIDDSVPLTDASVRFNTSSALLKSVKKVGVDFVSTANNHCLDRGIPGLSATIDAVEAVGLAHDGTFKCAEDAEKVFIKEIDGVKIAICCFTFGTNSQINGEMLPEDELWRVALLKKQPKLRKIGGGVDLSSGNVATYIADDVSPAAIANPVNEAYLEKALAKVRRARALADFVVVMPHVGGQYNPGPAAYAKYIVSRFVTTGANAIIAGHPHVPHRCEVKDGCLICYSLGNLCFTPDVGYYVRNVLSEYGVVLHLYINRDSKCLSRATFDVVKNVVDEDGCAHTVSVVDLLASETNAAKRDRLTMENEAVVNRFRGGVCNVFPHEEYEFE